MYDMIIPNLFFWGGIGMVCVATHALGKAKDAQEETLKIWKQTLKDSTYTQEVSALTAIACQELNMAIDCFNRNNPQVAQHCINRVNACIIEIKRLDKVTNPTE